MVFQTYSAAAHIGSIVTVIGVPAAMKISHKIFQANRRIRKSIKEQQKLWYS